MLFVKKKKNIKKILKLKPVYFCLLLRSAVCVIIIIVVVVDGHSFEEAPSFLPLYNYARLFYLKSQNLK